MKQQLINEAKRFQKLAGIKEEKGYYTTPTSDPKTAQVHFTTNEKPSLSKNYKPLSPKSQRKDKLTPQSIETALISALRNNKMDYEKSITIVSDKLNIDKDKLKQDFPKNDVIYKAGSIDEIVNEALENYRNEGIGKALKTAALGAALAFGSPEKSMAQTPQGIENAIQTRMPDEELGYKLWHVYSNHRSTVDLELLSPKLQGIILDIDEYQDLSPEDAKKIGHAAKKDPVAMKIINTSEEKLKAAGIRGNEDSLEEVVNKALATYRKKKLNEAEEAKVEQNIEDGLEKLLQSLKSAEQNVKPSPQDGQLDEIALTLAALITGAPGLLSFLGKGVDWLTNHYSLEKVDHTVVGNALQKAGHKLEHQYIDSIAGWLQASGKYKGQDPHDAKSDLHDKAHGIYAAMLAGAAIVSGVEAGHAVGLIAKGLEGGAAALKTSEVVSLAQKIAQA